MTTLNKALTPSLLALATLTFILSVPADASQSQASRFSRSAEGRATAGPLLRQRLADAPVTEHEAIVLEGPRVSPGRPALDKRRASASGTQIRALSHDTVDFLIYEAFSEVFYDFDGDGFFHGFAITFDADVSSGWADVYAELYLSRDGGPWNRYYTTRVFSIRDADSADAYEVVTDLDVGYPTGNYDVLIELYDAESGDFLTDLGPADEPALSWLPLEDAEFDAPHYGYATHGSGSTGPVLLIFIALLAAWRQRQRERSALAPDARTPAVRS